MKHLLTFLLALGLCCPLAAQHITQVEYFLDDADRGPGKNTLVAVATPGADVTQSLNIPLGNVAPGFHRLCVRAKDADNQWSTTHCRTFFVSDQVRGGDNITATEYFVDTDLGLGKNSRVAPTTTPGETDTTNFTVNLTNVPAGFHTLYVRSQDRNGDWGPTIARPFFVDNRRRPARITRLDYYYVNTGTAAASPVYAYPVRPGPRVDTTLMADARTLVVGQNYRLYVYATNENGERSLLNATNFTFGACENVPVPTVSIKSGTPGVSATLVLTAAVPGSPAGVTYQWLLNGNPIPGATAKDYPVAAADFGANGAVYAVRIALANGCRATSGNLTVTALEKNPAGRGLQVYPNPARDQLTVAFTPAGPAKAVRSTVHDALGREMGGQALGPRADGTWQTVVNTAGYRPGTYLLRVETGAQTVFRAFVKQ